MLRQFVLAVLLVGIVGVGLVSGVSGLAYIALVVAALSLSLLFVRRAPTPRRQNPRAAGEYRGSAHPLRPASSGTASAASGYSRAIRSNG
jgi:hypothetical protein